MILKDGIKHACRSCITGHRSSKCVHHDRELFPIAKKGRPSTQCKACKQRGSAQAGKCECQNKRKVKSPATSVGESQLSGLSEASTSRKDSYISHLSSMPPSDSGLYSRMLPYTTGTIDGASTHATNSSASSPTYSQQSFALHNTIDHQLVPGGLPYPQSDSHFAYSIHHPGQPEHHLELPPPRNMAAEVVRSRPGTAGEEEVPWWLYRGGYSPSIGQPYEPPPPPNHLTGHAMHQNGATSMYPDYPQYMPQPSPFVLGTPGVGLSNPPPFVWHNNATSYRDYMATQQNNYAAQPSTHGAGQEHRTHEHHHFAPAPHSADIHHYHHQQHQQRDVEYGHSDLAAHTQADEGRGWNNLAVERPPFQRNVLGDGGGDSSSSIGQAHSFQATAAPDSQPALDYESGSSRVTSAESFAGLHHLPAPVCLGSMPGKPPFDAQENSQSNIPSYDASLRERRSMSFDQIVSRASPINLKLPEDRKKRKFVSES